MATTRPPGHDATPAPDRPGGLPGRDPLLAGALTMLPLVAAYAPFGVVVGAAAAAHGDPVAGWAGSWLVYGGSAHLAALRTLDAGGPLMAVLVGLLVNARLVVYSAGLARSWPEQPRWFRVVAAPMIIDPTFAVAERYAASCADPAARRRHFVGAGLTLGAGWSAAIAAGAIIGSRLDLLHIDVVVPLCLLTLVGPGLRHRDGRAVAVAAAAVALLGASLPAGTGVLAAIVAGVAAGAVAAGGVP